MTRAPSMTHRTRRDQGDEVPERARADDEARVIDWNAQRARNFRQERSRPAAVNSYNQQAEVCECGEPALERRRAHALARISWTRLRSLAICWRNSSAEANFFSPRMRSMTSSRMRWP